MLELWGMRSTTSSLPGPLWPGVVGLDRVLSMGQIELKCILMLKWIVLNRTVFNNETSTGMMVWVFANGPGDLGSIPGRVIPKTQKWYLMPPFLTLSIIRYGSRVKWSKPGKRVAPFPTPRCSSYRKGSLRVTLDYGRQLYFYLLMLNWIVWNRTVLTFNWTALTFNSL